MMTTYSTMRTLRVAWATDTHFDKCGPVAMAAWANFIVQLDPDILVLTGDISHNRRIVGDLEWIRGAVSPIDVRFVLGNHDLRGPTGAEDRAFEDVRDEIRSLVAACDEGDLIYVHDLEPTARECEVRGYPGLVMLGVDGWWDSRAGVAYNKRVAGDQYRGSTAQANIARNARRADLDTWKLRPRLESAIERGATEIIVLTHVPPFAEACLHNGAPTAEHTIEYFSNVGLGTMLSEVAAANRKVRFLVLAGHTHDDAYLHVAPNLRVVVQGAKYGAPGVQLIELDAITREPTLKYRGRPGPWYEVNAARISLPQVVDQA